jgi:LysM repeat protein
MRLLKYGLCLLTLLMLIPLAAAQDDATPVPTIIDNQFAQIIRESDKLTIEDIIAQYGCPVGVRDENRMLRLNSDGTIEAGQTVLIPIRGEAICEIDYRGEIGYVQVRDYFQERYSRGIRFDMMPISEFAAEHNICEAAIRELNPEWVALWQHLDYGEYFVLDAYFASNILPDNIRVPVDSPACFETVELEAGRHPRDLAKELNVCEHVIWYFNHESIYQPSTEVRNVYIPLDRQPCYQDGKLLTYRGYPNQWGDTLPAEEVILESATNTYDYAIANGYCAKDLQAFNRHQNLAPLRAGDSLYISEDARHCDYVQEVGKTIVDLAYEYNVCVETIIDLNDGASSWTHLVNNDSVVNPNDRDAYYLGLFIPTEEPPCYDENGLRNNHSDRAVHHTSKGEWLFKIAQDYEVCMGDLVRENPMLSNYPATELPSLIFIPDTTCSDVQEDGFVHHLIQAETVGSLFAKTTNLMSISYIYNVCPSDILEANPSLILEAREGYYTGWFYTWDNQHRTMSYLLNPLEEGQQILIPADTLPCYDYQIPVTGIGHYQQVSPMIPMPIEYVCYAQEVSPDTDYTGHEPAISPIPYSEEAHCYNRIEDPRVVLNNVTYTLYPFGKDAYLFELAECFGANGYEIIHITAMDLGQVNGNWYNNAYWAIPNATRDCALIGDDYEAARAWKRDFYDRAGFGQINEEGLYAVTYGDSLSSIGRRYGYLPSWIKAENNLSEDWVYPYQLLRLPSYPNIYTMSSIAGVLLGLGVLGFGTKAVIRWRGGRKGKRKNSE